MRHRVALAAIFTIAGLLPAVAIGVRDAHAHEPRIVAGKYEVNVGFVNEPVEANKKNGVDLTVSNIETRQPVEGLEKTLKVDVTVGDQTKSLNLNAQPDQKGWYTGELVPRQSGIYIFRFYGTIESASVDERFQLGPLQLDSAQGTSLQSRTVAIAVGMFALLSFIVIAYMLVSRRAGQAAGGRHEEPI
jgi:hypothetical protein